jgi:hypothetical protein
MKTTNAVIHTSPFEGWGNHTQFQFNNLFACDEMTFPEPVINGKVTLNNKTFLVIYDKDEVDTTEGSTIPARLKEIVV